MLDLYIIRLHLRQCLDAWMGEKQKSRHEQGTMVSYLFCLLPGLHWTVDTHQRNMKYKTHRHTFKCDAFFLLVTQVGPFWPHDDKKTPNIEGLDVVSIETDLMRKGHCQRFFSEKGRRIIRWGVRRGGVRREEKKQFYYPFLYIPLSPPRIF